ncbi:hypothetical protein T265_04687 [Opisthorchis viverrini]|uniref:Uncharacterized protein n=1 Tax=Opisthorchis viverrini TaxID=6198 RepID=A0A075AG72_OPIVI|nr:hypothetical protein T265_04687 [Opisthorchis viverrini]KER28459.1 hypothetical protein T265_04687 [Opisthorchis viverrini]
MWNADHVLQDDLGHERTKRMPIICHPQTACAGPGMVLRTSGYHQCEPASIVQAVKPQKVAASELLMEYEINQNQDEMCEDVS